MAKLMLSNLPAADRGSTTPVPMTVEQPSRKYDGAVRKKVWRVQYAFSASLPQKSFGSRSLRGLAFRGAAVVNEPHCKREGQQDDHRPHPRAPRERVEHDHRVFIQGLHRRPGHHERNANVTQVRDGEEVALDAGCRDVEATPVDVRPPRENTATQEEPRWCVTVKVEIRRRTRVGDRWGRGLGSGRNSLVHPAVVLRSVMCRWFASTVAAGTLPSRRKQRVRETGLLRDPLDHVWHEPDPF